MTARDDRARVPAAEWAVAVLGAVLVLSVVSYLLVTAVVGDDSPPAITVLLDEIVASPDGYLVRVRAMNSGGATAAGITVEGELRADGVVAETSQATISYIPTNSERRAGLYFRRDPREHDLALRAVGYEQP